MPRISDRETERRMLASAIDLVQQQGISTGLESLAFDEVVRRAGVSRTSAYRRWPTRDRFYGDVLIELARGATLPIVGAATTRTATAEVLAFADRLGDPDAHRDLVVELLRISIQADYDLVSNSPQWRTYRLLLASYQGIADDAVRAAVTEALGASEQRARDLRARVYAEFTALLGYRLIRPFAGPDGFEFMSRAAGAAMRGVLSLAALGDESVNTPRPLRPFGASVTAEWTPAVYMVAATVLSYLEPDPGVTWDRERIDDLVVALGQFGARARRS